MLKINTLLFLLLLAAGSVTAQTSVIDTILINDFETDPEPNWQLYPLGNDEVWVNYDAAA